MICSYFKRKDSCFLIISIILVTEIAVTCFYLTIKDVSLLLKELFDSKTLQNAENRTVSNSLPLYLKQIAKSLILKWLYQAIENLK